MSGRDRPDEERKKDLSGRRCAPSDGYDRYTRRVFQILDRRRNFMILLCPPAGSSPVSLLLSLSRVRRQEMSLSEKARNSAARDRKGAQAPVL